MAATGLVQACPRGATIDGPAHNRRSTGTSPVAAITSRGSGSGCQSPVHGGKRRGAGYAAQSRRFTLSILDKDPKTRFACAAFFGLLSWPAILKVRDSPENDQSCRAANAPVDQEHL